jgi:hypothetical protein
VQFVGRTLYPAGSEGDTHSAVDNVAGTILVTTDEDFSPGERKAAGEPKLVGARRASPAFGRSTIRRRPVT